MRPILFIFGGLPGTGKSTIASALAQHYGAVYIRIDTIEQTMRNSRLPVNGDEGYQIGCALAVDNLGLGRNVVADSVNPLDITRDAWKDAARRANAGFIEIEIVCSDKNEHRSRVESRLPDKYGLKLPAWADVESREYQVWSSAQLVQDTAGHDPDSSISELLRLLNPVSRQEK